MLYYNLNAYKTILHKFLPWHRILHLLFKDVLQRTNLSYKLQRKKPHLLGLNVFLYIQRGKDHYRIVIFKSVKHRRQ